MGILWESYGNGMGINILFPRQPGTSPMLFFQGVIQGILVQFIRTGTCVFANPFDFSHQFINFHIILEPEFYKECKFDKKLMNLL